jgi:hypothetical protein
MFDDHTSVLRVHIVQFCKTVQEKSHSREDYEEFLRLCLVIIGGIVAEEVSFRAPGALHHAWWMATALCSIKIFLFQSQFSLTATEKLNVKEVTLFVSLIMCSSGMRPHWPSKHHLMICF